VLRVSPASPSDPVAEAVGTPGPSSAFVGLSGISALAAIVSFWLVYQVIDPSRTRQILFTSLVPIGLVLLDFLLLRHWGRCQAWREAFPKWGVLPSGLTSLTTLLALAPVTLIAGVSWFIPLFTSRGILLFTPYLIIILCGRLAVLVSNDFRWIVPVLLLVGVHPLSVYHYYRKPSSPCDYKALAEQLVPRLEDSDLVFIRPVDWVASPIFYYLNHSWRSAVC
jgi:hypothetical protein